MTVPPSAPVPDPPRHQGGIKPILDTPPGAGQLWLVKIVVAVPLLALLAAVPLAWGWGLTVRDLTLAAGCYVLSGLGVTVGFHRYFTHRGFTARRWVRIGLAIAGSLAVQGPVIDWVADHRRHHAFADRDGDPHSPWRYGDSATALVKGLWHAHIGWLLRGERSNAARFAPDLLADLDIRRVNDAFGWLAAASLLGPALLDGLIGRSWSALVAGLFWAGLVRVALLHHVTWSINSLCHVLGARPFRARDRSTNLWPLALISFGESWHNAHHADPTCARHGVLPGQPDISARVIWAGEKLGWLSQVRWPTPTRRNRLAPAAAPPPHTERQPAPAMTRQPRRNRSRR
jgi:stearoyl-CoA desaturase (delta-9 desaturase)